jgi:hypothetical protein
MFRILGSYLPTIFMDSWKLYHFFFVFIILSWICVGRQCCLPNGSPQRKFYPTTFIQVLFIGLLGLQSYIMFLLVLHNVFKCLIGIIVIVKNKLTSQKNNYSVLVCDIPLVIWSCILIYHIIQELVMFRFVKLFTLGIIF